MNGKELNRNLHRFLSHLDSIKDTLPMTILLLEPYETKAKDQLREFVKQNVKEIEHESGKKTVAVTYEQSQIFKRLAKNSETSSLASRIIYKSLFVSLISQYDAFLNQLFKILFKIRPEYINSSERELTFSQLINFDSIESAREYVVEKEVESVLRKSHSEHFDYLENKLSIPLRKDLPIWQTFIEITERRNLFVHCDGIVSSQYLKVCKENKCLPEGIELNKSLNIDIRYFNKAYKCLYELATKLTHTIWRKLIKSDLEEADKRLNEICYDLLNSGQFQLAEILLDFACKQNHHYNESSKNIFIINKALTQYLNNKKENAKQIIQTKDWSASSAEFKLAHLIITDQLDAAYELMKKIGVNGEVHKESYKTWPLFSELRKESEFKDTYKEVFNEEYNVLEIPKRPVQDLIDDLIEKNPELKERTVKKELASNNQIEDVSSK